MKRVMLATALAVLASASVVAAFGKVAPRARETVGTTIPVGIYTRVSLVSPSGNIVVNGVPNASTITVIAAKSVWGRTPGKARAALAGLTIAHNTVGDALEVRAEHGPEWSFTHEVEYYVTVPASFRVEATTTSGAVQVRRAHDVAATTVGGDIIITNVPTVTATTASGAVEIDSTSGPIEVHSQGGRVQVRVRGDIKPVYIQTAKGSAALRLPRQVNADLAVSTSKGPIVTEGLTLSDARQSQYGVRGQIGDGGVPVEVSTGSGGITITTRGVPPIARDVFLRPVATSAPDTDRSSARPARQPSMPDMPTPEMESAEGAVDAFLEGDGEMIMPEEPADAEVEAETEVAEETADETTEDTSAGTEEAADTDEAESTDEAEPEASEGDVEAESTDEAEPVAEDAVEGDSEAEAGDDAPADDAGDAGDAEAEGADDEPAPGEEAAEDTESDE